MKYPVGVLTLAQVKEDIKKFKELASGESISLGQCYEAYSKMHGFRDWNTLCAELKKLEVKHNE